MLHLFINMCRSSSCYVKHCIASASRAPKLAYVPATCAFAYWSMFMELAFFSINTDCKSQQQRHQRHSWIGSSSPYSEETFVFEERKLSSINHLWQRMLFFPANWFCDIARRDGSNWYAWSAIIFNVTRDEMWISCVNFFV